MHLYRRVLATAVSLVLVSGLPAQAVDAPTKLPTITGGPALEGTARLTMEGDIASTLLEGIDRFLLDQAASSVAGRAVFWNRDATSPERYEASMASNRQRLARLLGVVEPRTSFEAFELLATTSQPALVGQGDGFEVLAVRWPAFGDVHGEGLLLVPTGPRRADVIAVPDADQTPEMIAGLADGAPPSSQFARRLAQSGCRVLVPVLVDRAFVKQGNATITRRELVYRTSFTLGRHVIGYELQKVLAAVDHFSKDSASRIGVVGWGEGGMLALLAGALDRRIGAVGVSGYFGPREDLWQEPLDRNLFGILERFGDAELAAMIAPRNLVVEAARAPEVVIPAGKGGGPGRITTPNPAEIHREWDRARLLVAGLKPKFELVESDGGTGPYGSEPAVERFLAALSDGLRLAPPGNPPKAFSTIDPQTRQVRQVHELLDHSEHVLARSAAVREKFFERLDTRSLEKFRATVEPYRKTFADEVIGRFDLPLAPPAVRTRKTYDQPTWTGYEVVMDVFPNVIAYGLLLLPKDLKPNERRPVVVCQHGLEGRPQDVLAGGHPAYAGFATKLVERGLVVFAPQNLYLLGDRFRTLQRKANPLKKTLFSIIVPQHQQICNWLATLPMVDKERIAFYGLSYGGKTAMRVPPLVDRYCLSICSGDFDEWVWKNASLGNRYTYVNTGEYEIFEFDLGSTFNYAEMAALIAPRPFMVERGHFDGVAPDEAVGYEFAKVRFLYEAKLGIGNRCELEWFNGPHMVHGEGTFEFLHKHLNWPKPPR